jgi:hypothetical protein
MWRFQCVTLFFLPPPMPPHVPYGLGGLPSQLWPKCNRLLDAHEAWLCCPNEVDGGI